MKINNRIIKSGQVNWRKFQFIQSDKFKVLGETEKQRLKNSILNNHFVESFKVWENDDTIYCLDGFHRCLVLRELEKEGHELPDNFRADYIDCKNHEEAAKLVLIYSSIYAKIEIEGLNEFIEINNIEINEIRDMVDIPDIDLIDMSDIKIEELSDEKLNDADYIPEVNEKETICQSGDIWQLGEHRLICGDSINQEDVDKLMNGKKAAFCFTSPPYAEMRDYGGCELSLEKIVLFLKTFGKHCDFFAVNLGLKRKDNEIDPYWDLYIKTAKENDLKLSSWNIWSREGMGGSIANMTAMFPIEHEWIFVFGGEKERINRTKKNKTEGSNTNGATIRQKDGSFKKPNYREVNKYGKIGSIFKCDYARGVKEHPAVFPVELPKEYIKACSNKNDIIVEPFLGSGTSLIASEMTGRICYGMEIFPKYCDLIIKRWQEFTGLIAVRADGKTYNELVNK